METQNSAILRSFGCNASHLFFKQKMRRTGIEPVALGLKGPCSAN